MTRYGMVIAPSFHCEEAPCVDVCPTGASQKRKGLAIPVVERRLSGGGFRPGRANHGGGLPSHYSHVTPEAAWQGDSAVKPIFARLF
jgi:hypothetical protein